MERNEGAPAPDVIRLVGLGGVGRHGVGAEEREYGQTFLVDLDLHLDTSEAAATDDLGSTVNYAEIATQVIALIEGEPVNLIETLAARIADAALAHGLLQAVDVTVHKPEAPVGVPFNDVQVQIHRERSRPAVDRSDLGQVAGAGPRQRSSAAPVPAPQEEGVPVAAQAPGDQDEGADLDQAPDGEVEVVLGLGGNVGDVRSTLRAVVADLRAAPDLRVGTVSPLARTAAVLAADAVPQQDYLNAVVLAHTTLSPNALLELTQSLEAAYGRERTSRWSERTLDIDVITYDGVSSSQEHLQLPHPRASERAFVLVPWAQADPDAFLPGLGGGPVAVLADTAPDRGGVRWLALDWLEPERRSDSSTFAVSADQALRPEGAAAPGEGVAAAEPAPSAAGPEAGSPATPLPGVATSSVPPEHTAAEPAAAGEDDQQNDEVLPTPPAAEDAPVAEEEPVAEEVPAAEDGPVAEEVPAVAAPDEPQIPEAPQAVSAAEPADVQDHAAAGTPPAEQSVSQTRIRGGESALDAEPESAAQAQAEAEPTQQPEPEPAPDPEPKPAPDPEPVPASDPKLAAEPEPEPAPDFAPPQPSSQPDPSGAEQGRGEQDRSQFRPRWQPVRGDEST